MGTETNLKRDSAADILRCLSFCFVVCVHFLLNSGFYQTTIASSRTLVMLILIFCLKKNSATFIFVTEFAIQCSFEFQIIARQTPPLKQ